MRTSLIIATYNWPEALSCCLTSVMEQRTMPDEVVIADDGSRPPTTEVIRRFEAMLPVPLVHVWQPDEGFQLARIRNKAIARSTGNYIIQIDGDLILHPHFITDHKEIAKPDHFVTGSRLLLGPKGSAALLKNATIDKKILKSDRKNFFNGLRNSALRQWMADRYKTRGRHLYDVKGCNMAFWKKDLIAVNGYNEAFTGWGREDSELAIRLINHGVQKRYLKMGGIAYHLYHPEADRSLDDRNTAMMRQAIVEKRERCEKGLDQYLKS